MVKAKDIYQLGLDKLKTFDLQSVLPALRLLNEGAMNDVLNINGCAYYQWTSALIGELKFKQIVELGGAMGVWTIMALHNLPINSKLYSITLEEHKLEFSYIPENYPNLVKIIGNDLDLNLWPKDMELGNTDLWFIDTAHTQEQLKKELNLYKPFFKKGAIILIDDIHLNEGMNNVWTDIKNGKYGKWDCFDGSDPLHFSGFGLICV